MHNHIMRAGDKPVGLVTLTILDSIACDEAKGVKKGGRYCIMHDGGDAMLPEFGGDDPLLVDRAIQRFQGDAIYVFSVNGQVFVRALQRVFTRAGKVLRAIPYNHAYRAFEVDEEGVMAFEIFGRVIEYWHGKRC